VPFLSFIPFFATYLSLLLLSPIMRPRNTTGIAAITANSPKTRGRSFRLDEVEREFILYE
jgi:hypothetical protein